MYKIRTTNCIPHISGQITHHRTLKQIGDEKKTSNIARNGGIPPKKLSQIIVN